MSDGILHLSLFDGQVRALAAITTGVAEQARAVHNTASTATAALGRTLTGTALLCALLKGERDSITVTVKGNGPLGSIVCVGDANHTVKGYVDNPATDLPLNPYGKLDVGGAVGSEGYLTVIKDLGLREPYVGRTPLISGEIAEDFANYLLTSEQAPSLVALGVLCKPQQVLGAGGVLIQPMPGCTEETLQALEAHAPRLSQISHMAHDAGNPAQLALLALEGLPYRILSQSPIAFSCQCDRERIERVLLSLGEAELRDMIREQHGAQITCHFCNESYDFSEQELETLIAEGLARTTLPEE